VTPHVAQVSTRRWILFLSGINLFILQFVMVREFTSILYGEEVVIILVTLAYFLGLSLGYALSDRISPKVFFAFSLISFLLHWSLPVLPRVVTAYLYDIGLNGWGFVLLVLGWALLLSALYSIFLPLFIDEEPRDDGEGLSLPSAYALELSGAVAGIALIFTVGQAGFLYVMLVYLVSLTFILHLLWRNKQVTAALALFVVIYPFDFNGFDFPSTAYLYEKKHGFSKIEVMYSVNSPYQKVEVVRAADARGRMIYLNGLRNFDEQDLEALNVYLAGLPAELQSKNGPIDVLVVGSGTMASVDHVYPYAREVTTVELDGAVAAAGMEFFPDYNHLADKKRWHLEVDDGKHFLMTHDKLYDLVVMDVPSPLVIQEAILHSEEFYRMVKSRLKPDGAIAVQLSGLLQRNDRSPAQISAALLRVYDQVFVVSSSWADRGFAYAGDHLRFDMKDLQAGVNRRERGQATLYSTEQVRDITAGVEPISIDHLNTVLERGWERFVSRYGAKP